MTALNTDELIQVAGAGPDDPPQPTPPVWFTLQLVRCAVLPTDHC